MWLLVCGQSNTTDVQSNGWGFNCLHMFILQHLYVWFNLEVIININILDRLDNQMKNILVVSTVPSSCTYLVKMKNKHLTSLLCGSINWLRYKHLPSIFVSWLIKKIDCHHPHLSHECFKKWLWEQQQLRMITCQKQYIKAKIKKIKYKL